MELNITHTNSFQFESRDNLRNAARNILNRQGASKEASEKIVEQSIFEDGKDNKLNSQLNAIKAYEQIYQSGALKETLKYLKNNAGKKKTNKKYVLGELWNEFSSQDNENDFDENILNIIVDTNLKNIFEVA